MADGIFGRYPPARWAAPGKPSVAFPFTELRESGGNRIVGHERVHRDGQRGDDTGSKATRYTFQIEIYNSSHHEIGIGDGAEQYPDVVNKLIEACAIHEVGDLTVPTKGKRRCRAESWDRVERHDKVDVAFVNVVFVEDNEDDAAAAATQAPSASMVAHKYATDATAGGAEQGCDLSDLEDFASDLQDMLAAPGEFVGDIEAKVGNTIAAAERVGNTFSNETQAAADELATLLTDPAASRALRSLARLKDVAARAVPQKFASAGRGRVVSRSFTVDMSIFSVATSVSQPAGVLIKLNAGLPDLLAIPAGTPVRVFSQPFV